MAAPANQSTDSVRTSSISICSCEREAHRMRSTATTFPGTILFPIGLLVSGWGAQEHTHWIVPDIVSIPARRLSSCSRPHRVSHPGLLLRRRRNGAHLPGHADIRHRRVLDIRGLRSVHPIRSHHSPATHQSSYPALAAVSFLRSIAGFGFPLFAPAMYNALGYGVGNTMLAAIAFVIGVPAYVPAPRSVSGTVSSSRSPSRSVHRVLCFWKYGKKIRSMSRHAKVK